MADLTKEELAEWEYLMNQENNMDISAPQQQTEEKRQEEKMSFEPYLGYGLYELGQDGEMNLFKETEKFSKSYEELEQIQKEKFNQGNENTVILEGKIRPYIDAGDYTLAFYVDEKYLDRDMKDKDIHRTKLDYEVISLKQEEQIEHIKLGQEQAELNNEHKEKELKEEQEKQKEIEKNINKTNKNLNPNIKEAINTLEEKESIDKEIQTLENEKQEFIGPKQKREFAREKLDGLDKNEELKESLEILKEKEKIDEQIKEKEVQIEKEQEKREKEQNADNKEIKDNQENIAEQEDWIKKANELELQHEKELEELKDKQSRLEANFQKSIDNLMNSDGINGVITALQEMDRSLEMMMKQGKDESEAKNRQRQEKLELAFDSPKFRDAVGDLVKEVYKEQKEVKNGLKEMEKEHANYAKLQNTYEKEKKKGLDIKGYEKLKKMMGDIEKDTPNFKETYPKFHKKVNDTLEQTKDKILNKTKENTRSNENERML